MKALLVLAFFWFTLTMAHREAIGKAVHSGIVFVFVAFHYYFVPLQLAFGYVQTGLIVLIATAALMGPKNEYYNATALIVTGPIGVIGWIEGLACESFLVHIGGHFWYDMTIPIAMTAYIFYLKQNQTSDQKKTKVE